MSSTETIYQTMKQYIAAPLAGLALLVGTPGCKLKGEPARQDLNINEQNKIMYLGRIVEGGSIEAITSADMDGDGDMDIVAIARNGDLYVVFNNILQWKKERYPERER